MHRSGTSVLTHLLAAMGCHAGPPESLQPGDAANPRGYWESRAAWALDEEVLSALGASWWQVADLDLEALAPADRERFAARAQAIVAELDARRPWVLKEPRMSVLLPQWRPALEAPAFAFVHRDPLEVARSVQARDGFPLAVGLALWEVYTLTALRDSLGAPRVAVAYRRLLSEPAGVAAELVAAFEPLAPGALRVPSAGELAEVVRPELHRQRAGGDEVSGHLSAAQQRLLAALEDGSALAWTDVPAPSAGARELLRWFAVDERERRDLPDLRHRVAAADTEVAWRRDRDAEIERWNAKLRAEVAAAGPEVLRLQQRVAEVSRYNEDMAPRLAAAETELEALRRRIGEVSRYNEDLVPRLAAAEEELGRLRQRDGEISQWNEALTARLAAANEEAERAAAAREEAARAAAAHEEAIAALEGELADAMAYAERCRQQASDLDRLVAEVLRSRTWRAGRLLTAPLRWSRRDKSVEDQHDELHADVETLAGEPRDLARRAGQWSGGAPPPAAPGEPEG